MAPYNLSSVTKIESVQQFSHTCFCLLFLLYFKIKVNSKALYNMT